MIDKINFRETKNQVKDAYDKAFLKAMENEKFENDFILFIAHAEYLKELEGSQVEPAIVDYTLHRDRDKGRIRFMLEFLNSDYSFKGMEYTTESESSIFLELMIYCHIWESKPFLRNLKRLTLLTNNKRFPWSVIVPDSGKSQYINEGIADILTSVNLELGEIIKRGYNPQLRNAFAHSEFVINTNRKEIYLTNFKGEQGQIKSISFDDWTKRFCYSFLLNYTFEHHVDLVRKNLLTGVYRVLVKTKSGSFNWRSINFDQSKNRFH